MRNENGDFLNIAGIGRRLVLHSVSLRNDWLSHWLIETEFGC